MERTRRRPRAAACRTDPYWADGTCPLVDCGSLSCEASDVVLLLLEYDSLECVRPIGVCAETRYQPVAEAHEPTPSSVDRGTAAAPEAFDASQCEHPALALANLLELPDEVLPCFLDCRAVLSRGVRATAHDLGA